MNVRSCSFTVLAARQCIYFKCETNENSDGATKAGFAHSIPLHALSSTIGKVHESPFLCVIFKPPVPFGASLIR